MIFGIFTLIIALAISAIAAYYSIAGLTAIFAAAVVPIIIMGAALEIGKIVAALWLKINWQRANITYKLYLVPAVAILMLLTSLGIFGFLSKAHSDQSLVTGDSSAQIALYDEKIKVQRENIDTARKALAQLDAQVNERLSRGTSEQGVERAATLRRQQTQERNKLLKDITDAQNNIQKLNEERAPLAANLRKVEAEVGPIKYIAALVYGPNPDNNLLEKAVSWMIIVIVAVFDPLALVLILAAQQSIRWAREKKTNNIKSQFDPDPPKVDISYQKKTDEFDINEHRYLFKPWITFKGGKPIVATYDPEPKSKVEQVKQTKKNKKQNSKINSLSILKEENPILSEEEDGIKIINDLRIKKLDGDYYEVNDKKYSKEVFAYMWPDVAKQVNTEFVNNSYKDREGFGIKYPTNSEKGDLFVRIDYTPNRLFKFNGQKWIGVDKNKTDAYLNDDKYIEFLINKLKTGEYELDQLTSAEQDILAVKLQKNEST